MRCVSHHSDSFDTLSDIDNGDSYFVQNSVNSLKLSPIPSVLEIIDLKEKTYKVSTVALKKAPIMLCYYKHYTIPVILDTGAEYNVITASQVKRMNILVCKTSAHAI